jgi:hypothetical protein
MKRRISKLLRFWVDVACEERKARHVARPSDRVLLRSSPSSKRRVTQRGTSELTEKLVGRRRRGCSTGWLTLRAMRKTMRRMADRRAIRHRNKRKFQRSIAHSTYDPERKAHGQMQFLTRRKLSNETWNGSTTPGTTAKVIGDVTQSTDISKRSTTWQTGGRPKSVRSTSHAKLSVCAG